MAVLKTTSNLIQKTSKPWYVSLVNSVGYGLLLLVIFDLITMMIPAHLMNPVWEFQRFGELVEKVAVPLIAIVFIFFGDEQARGKSERIFLKGLSWLCLLSGVALIMLVPMNFANFHRLYVQANDFSKAKYLQQVSQIASVEQRLNSANNLEFKQFLQHLDKSSTELKGLNRNKFAVAATKAELLSQLQEQKQNLASLYKAKLGEQRLTLIKNEIKLSLGALLSGFIFIYISWLTRRANQV